MKPKRFAPLLSAAATLVVAISFGSPVNASTIAWDGSDSTAWATGTNWTGDIAPANNLVTDIALFNLASYTNQPNAGTTAINGIQIGGSSGALTLSGTSLSIGTGGITMSSGAAASTISAPITLGAAQTWTNSSANTLTVGTISRATGATAVFTPGAGGIKTSNTNTNGILGGWATVGTATGSGATADWATVDGSGNISAFTGYTTVSTGSATAITLDGSQAALNYKAGNSPTAVGGAFTTTWSTSGGGIGTINSLAVVNDNSVTSGSTLSLGSGGLILEGISRWILNNGTGSTAGTGQLTSGLASGELFVNVVSSAADANNWRVWTKIVDNGGTAVSLVKTGAGDLGLLNSNSFTGGTYLNSGTLSIANSGSLGAGDIRMNGGTLNIRYAGANVDLANNIAISGSNSIYLGVARNLTLNGTISGNGSLTLGNDGQNSSIYLNGTNAMTGGTITTANNTNSVRFVSAAAGNANVAWVINNAGANRNTFDFTTGTISFGSLAGTGLLQANNATGIKTLSVGGLNTDSTFSGAIGGGSGVIALTKVGSGTLTLSGANTYTGGTSLNGGAIQLNNASALGTSGTISFGGGVLKYGTVTTDLSARFSNAASQAYKVDTNGNNVTFASALTSSGGSLIKSGSGTLTLSGASTFSGATTISAGTLALASTGSLASTQISVSSGSTFDVSAVSGYSVGSGNTLTNNGTVNGSFTVASGGTLNGSGAFSNAVTVNGALNPGNSPGVQTYAAGLTLGAASTTTMEIAGLGGVAGTDFDFINVTGGTMTNGGALSIVDFGGFDISAQTGTYNLFDFVTGAGDFASVTVDGTSLTFNAGTDTWNATSGLATYDVNEGTGVLSVTVVPEPTAALLGGLGLLGLLRRRRVA